MKDVYHMEGDTVFMTEYIRGTFVWSYVIEKE